MNFSHSEEQTLLKDMLSRFLADTPDASWEQIADLGVIGALFGEDQGGLGGGGFDIALVFEELGRAGCIAPLLDCALLPGLALAGAGRDLEDIIAGKARYGFAHGEVAARYDNTWVETRANEGRLNGAKTVVVGAENAQHFIVSARVDGQVDAAEGINLYLVEADAAGLRLNAYEVAQGGRAADLTLNDTPAELLLEEAAPMIGDLAAAGLLAQSADTLGAMVKAASLTQDYLTTRKQFGVAIGRFQALAHRLADMMLEVEQARSAVILAASTLHTPAPERDRHGSACKNLMGRAGRFVAEEAIQMHGGIGMTDEFELGHYAKRIIMADHRFGDVDHHMENFIALSA